ncbi:MAG TPA: sulfatase [Nocardioides sp.]|nr:sulfatase [Nocardioides sp.]
MRTWGVAPTGVVALMSVVFLMATAIPQGAGGAVEAPASSARGAAADSHRPNVILVMADDMRVDDLRFAPKIRSLIGRRGLTFENSFSPFPLCCPARASLFTGQYAHNHHVFWHQRPYGYGAFDDSRTLATALKRVGYRTGFVGKYLNRYGQDPSKVSGEPSYRYVPRGWTDWRASFVNRKLRGVDGGTYNYRNSPYNVNGRIDDGYRGQYQTNVIGDMSVAMAKRFGKRFAPFFMSVNYVAPHAGAPVDPDDPRPVIDANGHRHPYVTPSVPRWVRGKFNHVVRRGAGLPRGGGPAEADISDKPYAFRRLPEPSGRERLALREVTRQRAEAVFVMDREVARLVGHLKRAGEWDETVLMFTSDNGYYLGEHREREGKLRGHEPSLRVPFLVTGPGMREGARRYDPISTVDVTATILDLAGASPPLPPDGMSRVPTMRHGDQGWLAPMLIESVRTSRGREPGFGDARDSIGLRTPRYSYVRHRGTMDELYDLVEDPLQMENVARRAAYQDEVAALDRVWWDMRNCAGASCQTPLPQEMQASAEQARAMTREYWAAVDRVYGW